MTEGETIQLSRPDCRGCKKYADRVADAEGELEDVEERFQNVLRDNEALRDEMRAHEEKGAALMDVVLALYRDRAKGWA